MQIIDTLEGLQDYLNTLNKKDRTLGFVATMGALHHGHLTLINRAKKECDEVICSIFVNPLQFNNQEDFNKYPITLDADKKMLESASCDALFLPTRDMMFPSEPKMQYDLGKLDLVLEGEYRPGHFQGMAAVVEAFLKLLKPDRAYFGEKDYQQLAIIQWLVKEKSLNTKVVPCKTARNNNGLAMSSRNYRLTKEELKTAEKIYEMMNYCKVNKSKSPRDLVAKSKKYLSEDFEVEYFNIVDENSLNDLDNWTDSEMPRVFVAAKLSGVRLIDNMSLID